VRGRGGDKGGDKYIHLLAFDFAVRRFSIPSGPDRRALMAGRGRVSWPGVSTLSRALARETRLCGASKSAFANPLAV
jgi:hypothetical protein